MQQDQPAGTVHWIDHFVVCTNDLERWEGFHQQLLGARRDREAIVNGSKIGVFLNIGCCQNGGFIDHRPLPPTKGLAEGLPRFGLYIKKDDLGAHLNRLKQLNAPHTEPLRTSAYGESGVSIRWQDPDGNQYEFWAPDVLPAGAMERRSSKGVGRISHAILESRDLACTAQFFARYCALKSQQSDDIPADRLVLPLAAGGRLIYEHVDQLQGRTTGCGIRDTHIALLVREEDYLRNYQRMWATLPEVDYDVLFDIIKDGSADLGPCTIMHPSTAGREFKKLAGRGDDWYDCDTNLFHFYGGKPDDHSFATYQGKSMQGYLDEWKGDGLDMTKLVCPELQRVNGN